MGFMKPSNKPAVQQQILTDQKEAETKANIAKGKEAIDGAFTQYDDPYYGGLQQTYMDYYTPQIDSQYEKARRDLTYQFADSGNLDSTSFGKALGELTDRLNLARTGVANEAQSAVDSRKQQVSNSKSGLYAQNQSAADPSSAATQAASAAGSLNTPLETSPLGDLFSSFISSIGAYTSGKNKTSPVLSSGGSGLGSVASTGNSSKVYS